MSMTISFDFGQRVSSTLSILLILVLSVAVAVLSLHTAEEILRSAQELPIVHQEQSFHSTEFYPENGVVSPEDVPIQGASSQGSMKQ